MQALALTSTWPVGTVSAGVLVRTALGSAPCELGVVGDRTRRYRLASIAKPISAWAMLVAVEEGIIGLDTPVGQPGCTLTHLLSHAGGYAFDGEAPIAAPGKRRIYSNTGIELAAQAVAEAAGLPFAQYLAEAVLEPLGMHATTLEGSPAHAMFSTLDDVLRFVGELIAPTLLSPTTAELATTPSLPTLVGVVPGVGRFAPCPWGLGLEIHGAKHPHWMGTRNSSLTFGHFGGAGTMMWVDPAATAGTVGCVALTDTPFDRWSAAALELWPAFSNAVLDEAAVLASGGR
ncbi:MAG: serine hydrolase domain-containing protein [Actinomycetota bacterium]